jgi:hypothetical protein
MAILDLQGMHARGDDGHGRGKRSGLSVICGGNSSLSAICA